MDSDAKKFGKILFIVALVVLVVPIFKTDKSYSDHVIKNVKTFGVLIGVLAFFILLVKLKIIKPETLQKLNDNDQRMRRHPHFKYVGYLMALGIIGPLFILTYLFSNSSAGGAWTLDKSLIENSGVALGVFLSITNVLAVYLCYLWNRNLVGVAISFIIIASLNVFFWYLYFDGQPGNLIFVACFLGIIASSMIPALNYLAKLGRE